MMLSNPHNMLPKIAMKRNILPCKHSVVIPTITMLECLQLNGFPTTLLVDSGACVNMLPLHVYQEVKQHGSTVEPTSTHIYSYGSSQPLEILGKCHITVDTFGKRFLSQSLSQSTRMVPLSWAGTHPLQSGSYLWDHSITTVTVCTGLHLNLRTLQTQPAAMRQHQKLSRPQADLHTQLNEALYQSRDRYLRHHA